MTGAPRGFFADYITRTGERSLMKWLHYFDVYDRELGRLRERPLTFLEIGIFRGGSIPMWAEYFAPGSRLVFVDIDPACAALEMPGTHVRIGNQADPGFLAALADEFGPFDVVLDDGSHLCHHQIASCEGLWPHLADGGLYVVEDCHTSYWPGFGGGYRAPGSFIEYAKGLIDTMHSWYTEDDAAFPVDPRARAIEAVRFYDSIVVLEKRLRADRPTSFVSRNGVVTTTQRPLDLRGRRSMFSGRDGG